MALATVVLGFGCGDGLDDDSLEGENGSGNGIEDIERPEGPAAESVARLEGGEGIQLATTLLGRTVPDGWVEEEYALSGTAHRYSADELPADGKLELSEGDTAEYRTRVVVRRPPADDFNGTVLVEWLNVSAGFDADPGFTYMADELVRGGYAWVGVSAQFIGVEGGEVLVSTPASDEAGAGEGLRNLDSERYGDLQHPGDAFAYDIFTQVARTLRYGAGSGDGDDENGGDGDNENGGDGGGGVRVLGDLRPQRLLASGQSQSAFMLTTYANGVHPLVLQYDGFLVHSRGGGAGPLGEAGGGVNLVSSIASAATRIRDDLDTPVLVLQSETDLLFTLNYFPARQPDSDSFRLWEMAGTAHADTYQLGEVGDLMGCPEPINAGPHHFMVKAALRHLDTWVREGTTPPAAERLEIDDSEGSPSFVRDEDGIVRGGIRTPQVDVPVDVLSGAPAGGSIACTLFGSTTPLSDERLAELYDSPEAYLDAYTEAADAVIEAGFVLPEDRDELLEDADPTRVGE